VAMDPAGRSQRGPYALRKLRSLRTQQRA